MISTGTHISGLNQFVSQMNESPGWYTHNSGAFITTPSSSEKKKKKTQQYNHELGVFEQQGIQMFFGHLNNFQHI